jgi:hypothetical protein
MNRDSRVFTARAQVTGMDPQVLAGPWPLDGVKDWKHKYSAVVYNRGNVDHQGYDLFIRVEYWDGSAWQIAQRPGVDKSGGVQSGDASMTVHAQAEATLEWYFAKGTQFRIVGYGVGGDTEGRIEMVETPFESNISDR